MRVPSGGRQGAQAHFGSSPSPHLVFSCLLEGDARQATGWESRVWVERWHFHPGRVLPSGGAWGTGSLLRAFVHLPLGGRLTSACGQPLSCSGLPPLCSQTISALKGKISELQWSVMNQEMQVKSLESEKQELQEQLALQRK